MGIFGALTTAVSGLRANAFSLENISGNIANSQTTAFKRIDTSFQDIVGELGNVSRAQTSGLVQASARSTNDEQGDILARPDGYFHRHRRRRLFHRPGIRWNDGWPDGVFRD